MTFDPTVVATLLTVLLGGGFVGSVVTLWTARKKVPAERDSIIVSGAETAVLALERALGAALKAAEHAEALNLDKDQRIAHLEKRLDDVQELLDIARTELHAIRNNSR